MWDEVLSVGLTSPFEGMEELAVAAAAAAYMALCKRCREQWETSEESQREN